MKKHTKTALLIGALVVGLWAASGFVLYYLPERGTFGDMFGAVNALFSGLAFLGVIYALLLQHDELDLTKAEFSRNAHAQKEVAQLQALTLLFQEYKQLSKELSYQPVHEVPNKEPTNCPNFSGDGRLDC